MDLALLKDLAASFAEASKSFNDVIAGMEYNGMDRVHPTNYQTGRLGFDQFNRFIGALRTAYLNELGLRADAAAMRELLRENYPDYEAKEPPKSPAESPAPSKRKRKTAE